MTAQLSVPNRLASSTSPYLIAHAENPVDWYPWCDEAFDEARRRGVPVFLSIGYSACHWCHVMAHESFENPHIAELMNEKFVNIKVDREELPTVDSLYMQATQALTGQGGWPMSVWLDHDRRPWYAGTYFPPVPSHASPSFAQVILAIDDAWRNESTKVDYSAQRLMQALSGLRTATNSASRNSEDLLATCASAVNHIAHNFDPINGGFGNSPKFPPALVLEFLMRWESLGRLGVVDVDPRVITMVDVTCEQMARSGLYDQIGSGFSRYCVDAKWVVPHFEKMLYDNAQLLNVYTYWWLLTANPLARRIVSEVAEFIISELATPSGGFAAALDADSQDDEGVMREGAYYVWNRHQIRQVIGDAGDAISDLLGISEVGNFEHGFSVPQYARDASDQLSWEIHRKDLRLARSQRSQPFKDDKIIASWNGLAISSLTRAAQVFSKPEWLDAALRAADFLETVHLSDVNTAEISLMRVSRDGNISRQAIGTLEDFSLVARAFLDLAQATSDHKWMDLAQHLLRQVTHQFIDGDSLIDLSRAAQQTLGLPDQVIDITDNVTPSSWAAAVEALLTYSTLSGDAEMRRSVDKFLPPMVELVNGHGRFAGFSASVLTAIIDGPREVALVTNRNSPLVSEVSRMTAPGAVYSYDSSSALLSGRSSINGKDTVYICRSFVCQQPITDVEKIRQELGIYTS